MGFPDQIRSRAAKIRRQAAALTEPARRRIEAGRDQPDHYDPYPHHTYSYEPVTAPRPPSDPTPDPTADDAAEDDETPTDTRAEDDQPGSGNAEGVPRGLVIAAAWSWRLIIVGILVYAVGSGVRHVSEVIVPISVATLLAALLSPVSNRLKRWGLPRGLAVAISVVGGLALVAGTLTLVGTQIASQSSQLVEQVVKGFNQVVSWVEDGPLQLQVPWDDYVNRLQDFLLDSQTEIATYAADIGTQVGHFLAGFAIAIFALFYFLYDGRRIWSFLLNFVPRNARARADHAARRGWVSLVSYVRATILVALVDAIGVLIVALVLQVPVAPALATLVFLGAFIPLVGAFVSGFVAVIVALVTLGWVQALIMLAGIIVVMQLEGHILQPFLLGRAVKLHPLAVLLGIAIGIIVGGIVGALMSIPLLAFAKTFVQDLVTSPPLDEPLPRSRFP